MHKTTVTTLFCLFFFCLSTQKLGAQLPYDPSEHLLIKFEPSASPSYINSIMNEFNATEVWTSSPSLIRLWRISLPVVINNGIDTLSDIHEVVNGASSKPKIKTIGADMEFIGDYIVDNPDNPPFPDPLTFCGRGQYDLEAPRPETDGVAKVAIIDTGISTTREWNGSIFSHELFQGYYDMNNLGYDFIENDPLPDDRNGHGTHVTGIIALQNELGYRNSIRFLSYKAFDEQGKSTIGLLIRSVDRAVSDGAKIVNCSFGFIARFYNPYENTPMKETLKVAEQNNVLIVAAAGNEESNNDDGDEATYPATFNLDNIISVAAGDCEAGLANFSNFGRESVDLVAPGKFILAPSLGGKWAIKSGTSQATAFVSYVAAVLNFQVTSFDYFKIKCAILNGVAESPYLSQRVLTEGALDMGGAVDNMGMACASTASQRQSQELPKPTLSHSELAVFPNPFHDQVQIRLPASLIGEVSIRWRDARGSVIRQSKFYGEQGGTTLTLDGLEDLPAGIYYLQVSSKNATFTKKLINVDRGN